MGYEIYKITNLVNQKVYIGLTIQGYLTRFENHLKEVGLGCDYLLHNAIRKYGKESFIVELIETCSSLTEMKEREIYWIAQFNSNDRTIGYNMTEGGDGTQGFKFSKESKNKIGQQNSATKYNDHVILMNENEEIIGKYRSINALSIYLGVYNKRMYEKLSGFKKVHFLDAKIIVEIKHTDLVNSKTDYLKIAQQESLKRAIAKSAEVRKTDKSFITKQQDSHPGKKSFVKVNLQGEVIERFSSQKECIRNTGYTVNRIKHAARNFYIIDEHFWIMEENLSKITPELVEKTISSKKEIRAIIKMDLEGKELETFENVAEAARSLGLTSKTGIRACAEGSQKTAHGFTWKYAE